MIAITLFVCIAFAKGSYRPVVIMHGMNNNENGYAKNVDALNVTYPGIYIKTLATYDDISSIDTPMDKQLAAMTAAIQSDPKLKQGFNFYGESQGALLARAYVTTVNDPPVYNLVAMNGPQNGVGECPTIEIPIIKQLCGDLGDALRIYHWPFCSFCSYWRGKDKQTYLDNSQWLADINNEHAVNETRRKNMISLNQYMATVALRDEVVQPAYSAWHTYWKPVKVQDADFDAPPCFLYMYTVYYIQIKFCVCTYTKIHIPGHIY